MIYSQFFAMTHGKENSALLKLFGPTLLRGSVELEANSVGRYMSAIFDHCDAGLLLVCMSVLDRRELPTSPEPVIEALSKFWDLMTTRDKVTARLFFSRVIAEHPSNTARIKARELLRRL